MDKNVEQFVRSLLNNTDELYKNFELNNKLDMMIMVKFTHNFVLEYAKKNGFKE